MTTVLEHPAPEVAQSGAPLVEMRGVEKIYRTGALEFAALRGVDLVVGPGEMVAVVGPSGSGKTTILNMITGIDRPTSGRVVVAGADLNSMSEERLARWRGETVGIVFQFFQLLPTLTALENAALPMDFVRRWKPAERWARARGHLDAVGLGDKADHLPLELSGGEQQRVAIARALACDPRLVVGDEPTGNLDSETGAAMLDLLAGLNAAGTTVLYVTHDMGLAARARRIVTIRDGRVVADETT
ncbi:MAG TPA: ABC transporter ATP-binding protein [Acidimicrobiales bacterium]|nr:ABC transporter ATP-binding protein [Acidimicrobiales bacterium]